VVVEEDLVDGERDVVLGFEPGTTSPISLAGTSGIWIFLMMSSRPADRDRPRQLPFTPAFATASFTASATVPGIVDRTVGDGVIRQRDHAEAGQTCAVPPALADLNGLSPALGNRCPVRSLSLCFPNILFNKFFSARWG